MLKWFLYLAILANVAIALWHFSHYQPVPNNQQAVSLLVNSAEVQLIKPEKATEMAPISAMDRVSEKGDIQPQLKAVMTNIEKTVPVVNTVSAQKHDENVTKTAFPTKQNLLEKNDQDNPLTITENNANQDLATGDTLKKQQLTPDNTDKIKLVQSEKIIVNKSPDKTAAKKIETLSNKTSLVDVELLSSEEPLADNETLLVDTMADSVSNKQPVIEPPQKKLARQAGNSRQTEEQSETCYSLMPLTKRQARHFSQYLSQEAVKFTQQQTTKLRSAGYLVMVAPSSNYKESKRKMKQVKKAGLDAFLITKGQWQRAISLGVFSSRANAEKSVSRARKKLPKIVLKIAERVREEIIYRIVFMLFDKKNSAEIVQNSLIKDMKGQFVAEVAKKSCKDIEFQRVNH